MYNTDISNFSLATLQKNVNKIELNYKNKRKCPVIWPGMSRERTCGSSVKPWPPLFNWNTAKWMKKAEKSSKTLKSWKRFSFSLICPASKYHISLKSAKSHFNVFFLLFRLRTETLTKCLEILEDGDKFITQYLIDNPQMATASQTHIEKPSAGPVKKPVHQERLALKYLKKKPGIF